MAKKGIRRKQSIPKDEGKAERFVRVVTPRVNKAVKAISTIGFCSGNAYSYTSKQIDLIAQVLADAVKAMHNRYSEKAPEQDGFSFEK